MIHLVPKDGARVRDPESKKVIGPEGIKIEEMNSFYFRRVEDGEMEIKEEKESKKKGEK